MRICFKVGGKYYDGDTGEAVEPSALKGAQVVEVTDKTTYKEKKVRFEARFLYRKRDGSWIGSSVLSTPFLYEVLKDRYGDGRFVLYTDSCAVCFLGEKRHEFFRFRSEEEKEEKIFEVFQGLSYTPVRAEDVLSLVTVSKKKKVLAVLLPVAGVFVLFLSLSGGEEEILTPAPPVSVPREPEPTYEDIVKEKIRKTQTFLSEFFRATAKRRPDVFFVSGLSFETGTFTLGSLIPADGFRWNGRFFEKRVAVNRDLSLEFPPWKDIEECREALFSAGARVIETGKLQEGYSIEGERDVEKVFGLLKGIYLCPASVEGEVRFRNLLRRSVSLTVYLYKGVGE